MGTYKPKKPLQPSIRNSRSKLKFRLAESTPALLSYIDLFDSIKKEKKVIFIFFIIVKINFTNTFIYTIKQAIKQTTNLKTYYKVVNKIKKEDQIFTIKVE